LGTKNAKIVRCYLNVRTQSKNKQKETIERSFVDAKELHGFRYCRLRGRKKVIGQALLTSVFQNYEKDRNPLGQDGLRSFIFDSQ
jgi:hypothetical protein